MADKTFNFGGKKPRAVGQLKEISPGVYAETIAAHLLLDGVTINVDEADLANVGAKADAAAADDTGVYSLIALIKRGLQNWTSAIALLGTKVTAVTALGAGGTGIIGWLSTIANFVKGLPTALGAATSANSMPVVLATDDAQIGTKVTASPALGAGGTGIIGWLSNAVDKLIAIGAQLPTTLGIKTAANSLSVAPGSDTTWTVASGQLSSVTVNIANGASLSTGYDLGLARAARIAMPATWTAANLTFQASYDNATWNNLYDSYGVEYTVVADASRSIILPISDFLGIRYIKIRSGTSATPVNQGAGRDLIVQLVA
jgi:hypothetical protein